MSDRNTPFEYAEQLLAVCLEALLITEGGEPERHFVSPTTPVLDCCNQLTVHIPLLSSEQTSPGGLAQGKAGIPRVNLVTLVAQATRCVPVPNAKGTPPSMADQQEAARKIAQDGWAIWNHLQRSKQAGTLFDGRCPAVFLDQPLPIAAGGGCAGWQFTVRPQVDGYQVVV